MEIARAELEGGRIALRFSGTLDLTSVPAVRRAVREVGPAGGAGVDLDVSAIDRFEGGAVAVLVALQQELVAAGSDVRLVGADARDARLLELYAPADRPVARGPAAPHSALEQIGRAVVDFTAGVTTTLDYLGSLLDAFGRMVRRPAGMNWADVARIMERAGADGVPIVVLISFLVGMVTAFQAIVQLRQFGADIFVADLVALSVARELGPLMTAIIVAGRSGAAFSAELGTMAVSEEIDALRTLGLSPYGFLVYPRLVALVLVVPLLTLVGDVCGIVGGVFVSMLRLDITLPAYLQRTQQVLDLWDVGSGVLKSVFFGWAIALVSCQRGLATRGGAAGVGLSTTSAVVASLFSLVVLDALFTVIFNLFEL